MTTPKSGSKLLVILCLKLFDLKNVMLFFLNLKSTDEEIKSIINHI